MLYCYIVKKDIMGNSISVILGSAAVGFAISTYTINRVMEKRNSDLQQELFQRNARITTLIEKNLCLEEELFQRNARITRLIENNLYHQEKLFELGDMYAHLSAINELQEMLFEEYVGISPNPNNLMNLESLSIRKDPDFWNRVLVFPSRHNSNDVTVYLLSAEMTVDVCMFDCTDKKYCDVLVKLAKAGILVRVVTCSQKWTSRNRFSDIRTVVPVRVHYNFEAVFKSLMHNKFVVIDGEAILTGSQNFSYAGKHYNSENMLVTTNPRFAEEYQKVFNDLWRSSYSNVELTDKPLPPPYNG